MKGTGSPRRSGRCASATSAHARATGRGRCQRAERPRAASELPAAGIGVGVAARLFSRSEERTFDLLDVALANEMLRIVGYGSLDTVAAPGGLVRVTASEEQVCLLQAICWDETPSSMESWMLSLAPRLVADVLRITGEAWAAEAELSVELSLSLRADDIVDLAEQLGRGPLDLDGGRSAADVIAGDVPDPGLIHFV